MASTSFAQLAPIARTASRASDARTARTVRPPTRGARAVTRAEAETAGSAIGPDSTETTQFYYCVANADFMLNDENNEHFPEILRERRRFFKEKAKPQDFWIVANPTFLDATPEIKAKIRQPCVAVVTTDKVWNDFVKLRLDRVYKGGVEGAGRDILQSAAPIDPSAFKAPENWTAPYAKYAAGWWSVFEPNGDF